MNEAQTRADLINPILSRSGWGIIDDSKILHEYHINNGQILLGGLHGKRMIADYILMYKGEKLAVIEAKSVNKEASEGVAQAKAYAGKLQIQNCFACNGREIYQICMKTGIEGPVDKFPTPEELWNLTFSDQNEWKQKFNQVPFENVNGSKAPRYYQEIAVNKTMAAISADQKRILLTLATGTGKTFIAFQIAWKLFYSRWNIQKDEKRRPRILFLADRNILADQAFNGFSAFPEDALVRINPKEIGKKGMVPTNGSIFFTIFQTFVSGKDNKPYFGEYPADFFDFIIIDECHRGGANDESSWREILEHFSSSIQLGLTATPKRKDNIDTYAYFGEPIYTYSLKQGVEDGFLTPFKGTKIQTTLDEYIYTSDDIIIEGEVEEGRVYKEDIKIDEREAKRVELLLADIEQNEKTIVFCRDQAHAAFIRDLINQKSDSKNPNYCQRVTSSDGLLGEQYLREFQDNEKTIPAILTTARKLSTGVDARNVRNIVLMRTINSMIEFKQIIGRGTRLFDGKEYFTIYDFVGAVRHFADPEWDGEILEPEMVLNESAGIDKVRSKKEIRNFELRDSATEEKSKMLKIKLRDGKEREIDHMISTYFYGADGKVISHEEFIKNLYDRLMPEFFKNEDELREIWSKPETRRNFLKELEDEGYRLDDLVT